MTLPAPDYTLAAESPAGHLRQVLMLLDGLVSSDRRALLYPGDLQAIRNRVWAALALLEAPR